MRAQSGQHIEQRGARGVQAQRIEHQIGAGKERRGAEKKCRRRKIAGNGGLNGVQRLRPAMETESSVRVSVAPKARSASSLWSRVRTASRTVVVPAVCKPASRTQVFTCALGTGVV